MPLEQRQIRGKLGLCRCQGCDPRAPSWLNPIVLPSYGRSAFPAFPSGIYRTNSPVLSAGAVSAIPSRGAVMSPSQGGLVLWALSFGGAAAPVGAPAALPGGSGHRVVSRRCAAPWHAVLGAGSGNGSSCPPFPSICCRPSRGAGRGFGKVEGFGGCCPGKAAGSSWCQPPEQRGEEVWELPERWLWAAEGLTSLGSCSLVNPVETALEWLLGHQSLPALLLHSRDFP